MATHANALAVMAKAPVVGRVKTRLLSSFTAKEAAELSRSLLVDQLNHLQELDTVDLYLAFAPDDAHGGVLDRLDPELLNDFFFGFEGGWLHDRTVIRAELEVIFKHQSVS